jgi:hypothetical protein
MKSLSASFILSVLLLSACGGNSSNNSPPLNERVSVGQLQGVWRSDGYHRLIEITEDRMLTYQFSQSHCLLLDDVDIEEAVITIDDVDQLVGMQQSFLTNKDRSRFSTDPEMLLIDYHIYFYDKVTERPLACGNGVTEPTDDAVVNFQAFWDIFNEHYAFFELRDVDWQPIYDEYLLQAEQIRDTGEGDVFDLIEEILPEFNDDHVSVTDEDNEREAESGGNGLVTTRILEEFLQKNSIEELEQYYNDDPQGFDDFGDYVNTLFSEFFIGLILGNQEIIADTYLNGEVKAAAEDQISWGVITEGNIGYISILEMANFLPDEGDEDVPGQLAALDAALDSAMADLQQTDALIIDVRFNGGGIEAASFAIASRFYDQRRLAFRKRARKGDSFNNWSTIYVEPAANTYQNPIYLLTSDLTASAAETFTLAMKELPYVTHIGEATNGVLSDIMEFVLPNGLEGGLSNEVFEAANGIVYEKTGIPVEYDTLFLDPNYRANNLDAGIEAVLQQLP